METGFIEKFERRLKEHRRFDLDEWNSYLNERRVAKSVMDGMVLDFLVKQGFQETAK